jgi:hypothetical protein
MAQGPTGPGTYPPVADGKEQSSSNGNAGEESTLGANQATAADGCQTTAKDDYGSWNTDDAIGRSDPD